MNTLDAMNQLHKVGAEALCAEVAKGMKVKALAEQYGVTTSGLHWYLQLPEHKRQYVQALAASSLTRHSRHSHG